MLPWLRKRPLSVRNNTDDEVESLYSTNDCMLSAPPYVMCLYMFHIVKFHY